MATIYAEVFSVKDMDEYLQKKQEITQRLSHLHIPVCTRSDRYCNMRYINGENPQTHIELVVFDAKGSAGLEEKVKTIVTEIMTRESDICNTM